LDHSGAESTLNTFYIKATVLHHNLSLIIMDFFRLTFAVIIKYNLLINY